ncbi:MAG: DNA mismatch repair protein MutL, partial [Chloroflexi bacterium]|nr:DNA mismatch repair protein MutL [Chloroflexota bacterium]
VAVRNLFRDFPARRKFLRSTATETARVQTMAAKYALAYPEVRFELHIDGSTALSTSGSGDLREAVAKVYGLQVGQAMIDVEVEDGRADEGPAATGLISPPSLHRANRSYVSLFVNRRWIQSRSLGFALEQAYHGLLMERRYPIAVLNISVKMDDLDVNVHPAKTEVRFKSESQVFGVVQHAVRGALIAHSPVPELRHGARRDAPGAARGSAPAFWPVRPLARSEPSSASPHHGDEPNGALSLGPALLPPSEALPALRVLGQVQSTYIVAEGPDGMYLIDQHAAHERVVFEKVRDDIESKVTEVQTLLAPETVALNAAQQELLASQHELVSRVGFQVEPFGDQTYLLRGVPALADGAPGQALLEVLDSMLEGGGFESWEERAAYSIACHGAIRAGKTLSHEEMTALTRQLEACRQPNTCPHGRPTMVHLSATSLEREFGRR